MRKEKSFNDEFERKIYYIFIFIISKLVNKAEIEYFYRTAKYLKELLIVLEI